MRARRAASVAVAFAATAAACSLVDLSGFSDGPSFGDAGPEASPPLEAAADVVDGATDVTLNAADAADAGPTTFCAKAGPHTLCDDFDTTADAGWTLFSKFGGGAASKSVTSFNSAPASFGLITPAVSPDAGEAWFFPARRVPVSTTHVRIEVQIKACNVTGEYTFLSVNSFTAGNAYGAVDVGITDTATGMQTYLAIKHDAFLQTYLLGAALPSSRFAHVVLETDLSKTNGSVKLVIDGTAVVNAKSLSTDQNVTPAQRTAWAGVYSYASPACTVRIDDVVIDAQ